MTAAFRQAMALSATLGAAKQAGDSDGLWRSFFPEAYQETRAPWLFAAQADFNDPQCYGDFPEAERHMQKSMRYMTEQIQQGNAEAGAMMGMIGSLMA
ncbi:MAG: hypothetical protein CBB94_10920 [Gammaproteobacteria bacterium TMED34]|nr:MAG: hypothetical protein CBB94_10920 [Gammaproteobacteria bacterium TMED34]